MFRARRLLLAALVSISFIASANGQETGSLSGGVFDSGGVPVEGATVRVAGPHLPAGRTTTTTDNGIYQFLRLVPGAYTVEATRPDVGSSKRDIIVELDRDAQVDFVLGLALSETIDVIAARSAVDLRKTEVNFNYTAQAIGQLPLERSYRGLFQLVPGVAENRSEIGPSAGGSRQDNTYLIDGVNITNPGFGYLSTEVNQLDIVEFNVKRGGVTAEFGRASGMVTNAISRSGTNEISGQARIDWLPQGLIGGYRDPRFTDPLLETYVNPSVGLGGPVLHDRVFFYGSARYFSTTRGGRRSNRIGEPLPDRDQHGRELFGKITGTPTPRHLMNVSFRDRPNDVEGENSTTSTTAGTTYTAENNNRIATATWAFFPTSRSTLDVKYLYLLERFGGIPVTNLGYLPAFNVTNLPAMGYYQDPARSNVRVGGYEFSQRIQYRRHEARATFTQFLDIGRTNHEVKAGGGYEFGEEDYFRLTNGWGDLIPQTLDSRPVLRARYYFEQPPQLGQGRTWSAFVQDNLALGRRLTVNAGVLFNHDEFAQDLEDSGGCPSTITLRGGNAPFESKGDRCTFIRYGFGDQIQPRLGANVVVREGKGDKAYVNWGRYYSTDQKSSARSLSPRRIFQREAIFDAVTGTLLSDAPRPATTGKLIDPDIRPTYSDEFLLGYATPLSRSWSLDAFYQYRDFNDFIEDVPTQLPDLGPFAAANLPCQRFAGCVGAEALRTYKALTAEVRGRFRDRLSMNFSYTWSRLEGNFDQDYAATSIFNTSSSIQDGPGAFVQEPNRRGPLLQDRPQVFKAFADYRFWETFTVGSYLRVQSGTPWAARGPDIPSASNLNYLEPAGSHRNPTWANLDLLAAYRVKFHARATAHFEVRLLNAMGNQTQLSTDFRQFLTLSRISTAPYIGPYSNPNALFGTADQYAPPRRLVLLAGVGF
jgi:hypothetical protein